MRKLPFILIAMVFVAGCNTQQATAPANSGANSQGRQTGNDENEAPVGNVQRGQADRQERVTQIFLDRDEFTELFGDIFSVSNPSPLQLRELEEVADTKSDSEKEEMEEKIQECKSAPVRCEIISD